MRVRTFVFGGLVGAAAVYLFDPVSGRTRRARLRDQAMARAREARRSAESRGRYVAHTVEGKVAEMTTPSAGPTDDATLRQRIHSDVFGRADVPKDRVTLDVADGVATLRGELDSPQEIDRLVERVRAVPGVLDVAVLIHLPGKPAPNKEPAIEASRAARGRGTGRSSG